MNPNTPPQPQQEHQQQQQTPTPPPCPQPHNALRPQIITTEAATTDAFIPTSAFDSPWDHREPQQHHSLLHLTNNPCTSIKQPYIGILTLLRPAISAGVNPSRMVFDPNDGKEQWIIGRGQNCDFFVYISEHPSFLSRHHATIMYERISNMFILRDERSINGLYVNGTKLDARLGSGRMIATVIRDGDRIYFGNRQHSFFLEFEFRLVPVPIRFKRHKSSLPIDTISSSSPCVFDNTILDDSIMTSSSPEPSLTMNETIATTDLTTTTTTNIHAFNNAPAAAQMHGCHDASEDVWMAKILLYLSVKEITVLKSVNHMWRARVDALIGSLTSLHWDNRWPTTALFAILNQTSTTNLKRLNLNSCFLLEDADIGNVARLRGESLHSLDVSGIPSLTHSGMAIVAKACPNLEELILRGCRRVGGDRMEGEGDWAWITPLAARGTLKIVDLYCTFANDQAVTNLLTLSPHIVKLDLGVLHSGGITDKSLQVMARYSSQLEHLDIRGCRHVTSRGIHSLVSACCKLTTLGLHSCTITDDALVKIGTKCTNLKWLNLHRCSRVTDSGLIALFSGSLASTLEFLDVSNMSLTDFALGEIANAMTTKGSCLNTFDCRSCHHISGEGILSITKACRQTLLHLDVNGCNISTESLYNVARLCSGVLRHFEIGGALEPPHHGGGGGTGEITTDTASAGGDDDSRINVDELRRILGPQTMVYVSY